MTPEEIATALVASGYAHRLPLSKTRCLQTIELAATRSTLWGKLYVTSTGDVRVGYTLRASRRVAPSFRRQVAGE